MLRNILYHDSCTIDLRRWPQTQSTQSCFVVDRVIPTSAVNLQRALLSIAQQDMHVSSNLFQLMVLYLKVGNSPLCIYFIGED